MQGHGGEHETVELYRGSTLVFEFVEKVKIDIAVSEPFVEPTIAAIVSSARTGEVGDAVGAATGVIVGLVGITPAAGFVTPLSAIAIGALTAAASFASKAANPAGADGLLRGNPGLVATQALAVVAVVAYTLAGTGILLGLIRLVTPLRVEFHSELEGLDRQVHGEDAYRGSAATGLGEAVILHPSERMHPPARQGG